MICNLCPRKCNASRNENEGNGACGCGTNPVVARVAPHFGEEPCISGKMGSGTIFFSGCTLKCAFCQNYEISLDNKGKIITPQKLSDCYKALEQQGVHNINLVTADHFVPAVVKSFEIYKPKIPIVYNCSGYESAKILNMLDGIVDIYLPDFKYSDDTLALKLSSVNNYVFTATTAIKEMLFQVGLPQFYTYDDGKDEIKMMKKGVIIRHLILPAHTRNSIGVIELVNKYFKNQMLFSLMSQYVPLGNAEKFPKINRKITRREYEKVKYALDESELDGFTQSLSSATDEYVPNWDY